jgi:signal peptidase
MAAVEYLVVWSIFLFVIFIVFYLVVSKKFKPNFKTLKYRINARNKKRRVELKLSQMRGLAIPKKAFYPFLPLIPFLIIVYIFVNHMLFFAVITTDSMSPTFEKGDIVLMQSVDLEAQENDIIMFENKNPRGLHPPVIHRVDNLTKDGILTKGDATNIIDDWIVEDDEVTAKAVKWNGGQPVVIPEVGNYFIQDYKAQGKYATEFVFTSVMVVLLKDIGIAVFTFCLVLYIILSVKEAYLL